MEMEAHGNDVAPETSSSSDARLTTSEENDGTHIDADVCYSWDATKLSKSNVANFEYSPAWDLKCEYTVELFLAQDLKLSTEVRRPPLSRVVHGVLKKKMDERIIATGREVRSFSSFAVTPLISIVYYYPNDASESVRLDYQSILLDYAFEGRLHQAPLANQRTILDIGTRTGAWAIQMPSLYPDSRIEATDPSPIQPLEVPENVTFIIDDAAEDDWTLHENYYDYIHTRIMMGCFEDFKSIIRKGFQYTQPGGWMESVEIMHTPFCDDGTMAADWPFKEWTEFMEDAAKNANWPLRIAHKLKKWYTEIGFVGAHERVLKVPINTCARDPRLKTLGHYWTENLLAGLEAFSLALFSRVFGWSKTEIDVWLIISRLVQEYIADWSRTISRKSEMRSRLMFMLIIRSTPYGVGSQIYHQDSISILSRRSRA